MFNYLRAECYKVLHRRLSLFLFLGLILLGEVVLLWNISYSNSLGGQNTYSALIGILFMLLQLGLYCAVIICDFVYSDQYKHNTLKNEISYGLSRMKIYFGKLMVSAFTALVLMALVLGFYLGVGRIAVPFTAEDAQLIPSLWAGLLTALPLWLGALGVTIAVFFNMRSSVGAAFTTVGIIAVVPGVLQIFYLLTERELYYRLYQVCLTAPFDSLSGAWADCGRSWAIGMGWLAVSTVVGLIGFSKKEIN